MDFGKLSATVTMSTMGYVHKGTVLDAIEYMGVKPEEIGNLYQLERTDIWYLRFRTAEFAELFVDGNRRSFTYHDITFVLKLLNSQCVEVRLHWVPDIWSESFIAGLVKDWGKILGLHTGRISARNQCIIELKLECTLQQVGAIPHLMEVSDGTRILVTVPKRAPLCLGCKELGHIKFRCPNFVPNRSPWGVAPTAPTPASSSASSESRDEPRSAANQSSIMDHEGVPQPFPRMEPVGRTMKGGAAAKLAAALMPSLEPIGDERGVQSIPVVTGGVPAATGMDGVCVNGAGVGAGYQSIDPEETVPMVVVNTAADSAGGETTARVVVHTLPDDFGDIDLVIGASQMPPGQPDPPPHQEVNVNQIQVLNRFDVLARSRSGSPARSRSRSLSRSLSHSRSRPRMNSVSSLDRSRSPSVERSPSPVRKVPQQLNGDDPRRPGPQDPQRPPRPVRRVAIDAKRVKTVRGAPGEQAHLTQLRAISKTRSATKTDTV
jgi:hypothetical protein